MGTKMDTSKLIKKPGRNIALGKSFGTFIVFIVLFVFFSLISETFLTANNLLNILLQVATMMIVSVGATWVIISGCIDLSIGANFAFSGVAAALLVKDMGLPIPLAILCSVLFGGVIGLINGTIVTKVKIPPLLTTIGTSTAIRGLAYIICGGKTVFGLPDDYSTLGQGYIFGIFPIPVLIAIIIVAVFLVLQAKSAFVTHTYAVGNNPNSAFLSGINTDRHILSLYLIVGLLAGMAAFINSSRMGVGLATTGDTIDFDIVTAVVLGGTNIMGGSGNIQGSILGCLIIGVLANGMQIMNMQSFTQQLAKGVILLVAIGAATIRTKKML